MVELVFASDRQACSIFVPVILGRKVIFCCALPPGSTIILQEEGRRVQCRSLAAVKHFHILQVSLLLFL